MLSEDIWATTLHQSSPFSIPSKAHYPTTFLCGSYHPLSSATPARPCKISDQWQTWLWQQRQQWSVEQRMSARTMCCFGRIERRHGHSWCTRYYLIIMFDIWCASCPSWICSHSLHLLCGNEASVQEQRMKSMDSPQVGGLNLKHSKTLFFWSCRFSMILTFSAGPPPKRPSAAARQVSGTPPARAPVAFAMQGGHGYPMQGGNVVPSIVPMQGSQQVQMSFQGMNTQNMPPATSSTIPGNVIPQAPSRPPNSVPSALIQAASSSQMRMQSQAQYVQQQELCRSNPSPQPTQWVQQHQQVFTGTAMRREGFGHEALMTPKTTRQEVEERPAMIFLLWPTTTTNHRCSLSCDPCDQIVTYSAKLCEHASHILPVPWFLMVFPVCFLRQHASTILITGHWSCIWRRGTEKRGGSALVFVCMEHYKSIEIAMDFFFTPFTSFDSKPLAHATLLCLAFRMEEERTDMVNHDIACGITIFDYMIWSHNMMPTKYSGKGVGQKLSGFCT